MLACWLTCGYFNIFQTIVKRKIPDRKASKLTSRINSRAKNGLFFGSSEFVDLSRVYVRFSWWKETNYQRDLIFVLVNKIVVSPAFSLRCCKIIIYSLSPTSKVRFVLLVNWFLCQSIIYLRFHSSLNLIRTFCDSR